MVRLREEHALAVPLADHPLNPGTGETEILGVVLRPESTGVGRSTLERYAIASSVQRAIRAQRQGKAKALHAKGSGAGNAAVDALKAISEVVGTPDGVLVDDGKSLSNVRRGKLYSPERNVTPLGFYSSLADAIAQVPARLETQPAAQWKAWLKSNAPKLGIKADEIEWTGINDWLDLQKGKIGKRYPLGKTSLEPH